MNFRTTLVLLVVVIVAILAAFILQVKVPPTEKWDELRKQVFKDFNSSDATKLEIKTKDRTLAFEKKDDKWHMTGPLNVRADKTAVMGVLDTCESLKKAREVEFKKGEKLDLAKYGLQDPQVAVTFWTKPKKAKEELKRVLLVGNKTPGGDNLYVSVDDKKGIMVVNNTILDKATKETNEFRDKVVIEIEKEDVEKIELGLAGAAPIECSVKDKEGWFITQPISDLGSKDTIEEIINKLKDLKVEKDDFISEDDSDLKNYGLDDPRATVTVYQKGAGKTLLLGKPAEGKSDEIYAKRKAEPSILAVKKSILDDLKKEPKDLRSKKVLNIASTSDVNKIEIQEPSQTVLLEKKEDKWSLTKPAEEKAESQSVSDFLDAVKNLAVDEWVAEKADDLQKYGLDKPIAVSLFLKDQEGKPIKFLVGHKDKEGKKLYVKREATDVILAVGPAFLDNQILPGRLTFRDKKILEFTRSDAKKLTVARKDKTFVCLADDKGDWKLEKPIQCEGDKGSIDSILWDFSYLKAKNFVAESPKDLKPYGLDAPAVTATIEYDEEVKEEKPEAKAEEKKDAEQKDKAKKDEAKKDEEKPKKKRAAKTLLVGKKIDDGDYYAMLKDSEFVFVIRSSIVEHLNEELAAKKICSFEKDMVARLTLKYPAKEVVYEKKADKDNKWWMVKPKEEKATQADVDDVLNGLDDFSAAGIEAYSAADPAKYGFDKPTLKITVALKGEGEKEIVIGQKKKETAQYFVRCQPSDFVFLVGEADINKLRKETPQEPKKQEKKPVEKAGEKKTETEKPKIPPPAQKAPAAPGKPSAPKPQPAKPEAETKKGPPAAKPKPTSEAKPTPAKPAGEKKQKQSEPAPAEKQK